MYNVEDSEVYEEVEPLARFERNSVTFLIFMFIESIIFVRVTQKSEHNLA